MTGPHMPIPLGQWRDRAKCLGLDPEDFFPHEYTRDGVLTEHVREIKALCGTCVVQDRCLDEAVTNHDNDGMFGGLTPNERKHIRRGRKTQSTVYKKAPGCGTEAAYRRHIRKGEEACEPCKAAHNANNAKYPKKDQGRNRKREKASA